MHSTTPKACAHIVPERVRVLPVSDSTVRGGQCADTDQTLSWTPQGRAVLPTVACETPEEDVSPTLTFCRCLCLRVKGLLFSARLAAGELAENQHAAVLCDKTHVGNISGTTVSEVRVC